MPVIDCPACGARVPDEPICLCMPDNARCKRNHNVHAGCPYEPLISPAREPWVLALKPLPPEEAEALRDYMD